MGLFSVLSKGIHALTKRSVEREMERAGMKYQTHSMGSYSVSYWDNGSTKPFLVLLHGFGLTAKYQWFKQVRAFTDDYRVLIPDLLYFGESNSADACCTVGDQVDFVRAFLKKMGVDKCSLCGVSYGGIVAMEYALRFESELEKLIVVDAPVKYMTREDVDRILSEQRVSRMEDLFVPESELGLKKLMQAAIGTKMPIPPLFLRDLHRETYTKFREEKIRLMECLLEQLTEFANRDYPIKIPVLLVWGEDDVLIPLRCGEQLKTHIGANAQLIVIPNGAHMPNITQTKLFNRNMKEFLNS